MTRKALSLVSLVLIGVLGACGSAAAPTLSVVDIQQTGVALAWTGLAMTQTAMPTTTPAPTETQLPTAAAFPTLASNLLTPAVNLPPINLAAASPTSDTCSQPPPAKPQGDQVQVKLINQSKGSVNLSLGMETPNSLGECATYGFVLGPYNSPDVELLAGCYWGFGWVTGQKPSTARTPNDMCMTDTGTNYGILIGTEVIGLKPGQ